MTKQYLVITGATGHMGTQLVHALLPGYSYGFTLGNP